MFNLKQEMLLPAPNVYYSGSLSSMRRGSKREMGKENKSLKELLK